MATAKVIAEADIKVETVLKVHEGRPNIEDLIRSGEVQLIINTPIGRQAIYDDKYIRRAALDYSVPTQTTLAGARAAVEGINSLQIYKYLLSKRILCSVTKPSSGLLYFKKLKVKDLLRISFHQYNSYHDINYLVKCLIDLIKKKAII